MPSSSIRVALCCKHYAKANVLSIDFKRNASTPISKHGTRGERQWWSNGSGIKDNVYPNRRSRSRHHAMHVPQSATLNKTSLRRAKLYMYIYICIYTYVDLCIFICICMSTSRIVILIHARGFYAI